MDAMGARCSNHDQPECVLRLDPGARCNLLSRPVLGLIANFMPLVIYHNSEKYREKYHRLSLQLIVAWGWAMFVIHTLLTIAILMKLW